MKRILTASLCLALGSMTSFSAAQSYSGVVPGSGTMPEHLAAQPGGSPLVTWPGFQMTPDGGSRVFVQTTTEVQPKLKREGKGWSVVIPGVALPRGNSRLPLDTHFFNTPLLNVRLRAGGNGVVMRLAMRPGAVAQPRLRVERAPTGYFFTYVEFAPGDYR